MFCVFVCFQMRYSIFIPSFIFCNCFVLVRIVVDLEPLGMRDAPWMGQQFFTVDHAHTHSRLTQ